MTFEKEAVALWQAFVAYMNGSHTQAQYETREAKYDKDYEALMLKYSHPAGRPKRHR